MVGKATLLGAVIACIALATPDAKACSPATELAVYALDPHPANAAVFGGGVIPGDISEIDVTVDGGDGYLISAHFPQHPHSYFIIPPPEEGDEVKIASRKLVMGPRDDDPPKLEAFYFDLHDHPGEDHGIDSCGGGGGISDLTYLLRVPGVTLDEVVFVELRHPRTDAVLLRTRASPYEGRVEVSVADHELAGVAPEQVCVRVEVTDLSGNALTPITSCSPCHFARTASDETPDWSDATLHPDGTCETPPPSPRRLPGLADQEEPSGCQLARSTSGPAWLSWLMICGLALLRRDER